MEKEIEVKFLNIDRDDLVARLVQNGFTMNFPETRFFRSVFHFPDDPLGERSRARVRDEGGKIIMNVKRATDLQSPTGTMEAEIAVDDYAAAERFLAGVGLVKIQEIENTREQYSKGGVMVCIDHYPGVPVFCEIESPNETRLRDTAAQLGFSWDDAFVPPLPYICEKLLGISVSDFMKIPSITFSSPLQERR